MPGYFSNFPVILYDSNYKVGNPNYTLVTNPLFRLKLREQIKNYNTVYTKYVVTDNDTPEGLAFKIYGDPHDYWLIFFANDIIDANYDWPLSYQSFRNYLIEKYGSVATTKTTIHHYERVVTTTDTTSGTQTVRRYWINENDPRTNEGEDLPFENYDEMAETEFINPVSVFRNGYGMEIKIEKEAIYVYDYEWQLNENKRNIKLIKKEFVPAIKREFENLSRRSFREVRNF